MLLRLAVGRTVPSLALLAAAVGQLGAQSVDSTAFDSSAVRLAPITAGLRAPARSIGSTQRSLDSSDVRRGTRPRTLSELLQARFPGVSVLRFGGDPSNGARVRVRGATTIVGAAEPLLVVDGIPVSAPELLGPETSLSPASRFDDFDPEEVERIDVLAGPAATTLFGAGASNGAIVVMTKRGATGRPRWDAWSHGGVSSEPTAYPANYRMNGISTSTGAAMTCDVVAIANQQCTPTTMDVWNPLEAVSPFRTGRYGAGGGSVVGGPLGIRIYAGALGRAETSMLDDSRSSRVNGRLNAERELFGQLTLAGNLGYVRRDAAVRGDNIVARGLTGSAVDDTSRGYRPRFFSPPNGNRDGDRLSRSARAEWRAMSWLRLHAMAGRDELTQEEARTSESGTSDGALFRSTMRHWQASSFVSGAVEAQHRVGGSVGLRTIVSYEESSRKTAEEESTVIENTPCDVTLCQNVSVSGMWTWSSIRSWMVQERIAVADRFFFNLGARRIAGERSDGGGRWHPSVDAAWELGRLGPHATLRLRGAYAVGVPPRDAGLFFGLLPLSPTGTLPVGVGPRLVPIEPEQPREAELGLDASLGSRVALTATFFDQWTPEVIVPNVLQPPSGGFAGTGVALGRMQNQGVELTGRVDLVDRPTTSWTAAATLATIRNRVSGLDEIAPTVVVGPGVRNNQPFGVFLTRRARFVDANGDNLPSQSEITLGEPEPSGSVYPTREASLRSELGLKRFGLALSATLDHRGGHRAYNMTQYYGCLFRRCRAWQDPTASLAEKTEAVASSLTQMTQFGLEDASYTRLSELAVAWTPSPRFGRVFSSGLTIVLEARNVLTWTSFGGPDPEVATTSSAVRGRQQIEMLPALPRTVGVRIDFAPR